MVQIGEVTHLRSTVSEWESTDLNLRFPDSKTHVLSLTSPSFSADCV